MSITGFNAQTKAWVKLVALVLSTGSGVAVTSYLGGANVWIAVLCGLGTAGTNVYTSLADSPQDAENQPSKEEEKKP